MLLNYINKWDPVLNSPTLIDGVGTLGDTYIVALSNGGFIYNRNLGSGLKSFAAFSYVVYNGTTWESTLNI